MKEAFENVEKLLLTLKPTLIQAGVPEHQVRMPVGREPHEIPLIKYVDAFDWLHRLSISGELVAVQKALALLPQEMWERYKLHGFQNLQEQNLLNAANKKLCKAWRSQRPHFFGATFKNRAEENPDGESDRPAEAGTGASGG